MRSTTNFALGLLLGGLVGATVVLLLTPQSGEDIQNNVKSRVNALLDEGRKASNARKAELSARIATIQPKANS